MMPKIYDETATVFSNAGEGTLQDCASCKVKEELNGEYELALKYPVKGPHADLLQLRKIIYAKPNAVDEPQAFRIYHITRPMNNLLTVEARHVAYDLSGYPVENFTTSTAVTAGSAMAALKSHITAGTCPFRFFSNKESNTPVIFQVTEPGSVKSWMGGREGSILDLYPGDWKYNNFKIYYLDQRGNDKGMIISDGKNLTKYEKDMDDEEYYTGVWAFYHYNDGETDTLVKGTAVQPTSDIVFTYTKVLCLDATNDFFGGTPTPAELDTYAQKYIKNNGLDKPMTKVAVDFLKIKDVSGNLELGDTITIKYRNERLKMRVRSVTWNVLAEKYDSVSVGTPGKNLTDTIKSIK